MRSLPRIAAAVAGLILVTSLGAGLLAATGVAPLAGVRTWMSTFAPADLAPLADAVAERVAAGAGGMQLQQASVQTDKSDYRPGETAIITGAGWGSAEDVVLHVTHADGTPDGGAGHQPWTTSADPTGNIASSWYVDPDDSVGSTFRLTATGVTSGFVATTTFTDNPAASLEQCRNGSAASPNNCLQLGGGAGWVPGNAGASNSHYLEGYSIPYRAILTDLPIGQTIKLDLGYDIRNSGRHSIDFLTQYQRLDSHAGFGHPAETVTPSSGVAGVGATTGTFPIPVPSSDLSGQPGARFASLPLAQRVMTLFGGTISNVTYVNEGSLTAASSETEIQVTFTPTSATAVLAWGGHIARAADWGNGNSAAGINGSSYHMRVERWQCDDGLTNSTCDRNLGNLGNQDRSLSTDAVFPSGTVIIQKQMTSGGANTTFSFTDAGLSAAGSFNLNTDPDGFESVTFTDVLANGVGGVKTVSESGPPSGWNFVSLTCSSNQLGDTTTISGQTATLDVDPNETITCIYTNQEDFNVTRGKIIVDKVTNPTGDSQLFTFTPTYNGGATFNLADATTPNDSGFLTPGTYSVSEAVPAGWALTNTACVSSTADTESAAALDVDAGETITCTFTNTKKPTLTLVKVVTNNNGGTKTVADFALTADGAGTYDITGVSGTAAVTNVTVDADTFALSEVTQTDYTAGAWVCVGGTQGGSNITLANGQSATCTITNDDNAPSLTLNKIVVNDNGGTAAESAWTLTATGASATPTNLSGPGAVGAADVVSGTSFKADTYTLAESGTVTGYTNGTTYSCVKNGGAPVDVNSITLANGDTAVCTITNNDNAPSLTLVKVVTNDNGGTATAAAWTLTATGPTGFSGVGPTVNNGASFDAGAYALTESSVTGYTNGTYACVGGTQTGQSIAVALGESAVCTVINTDNAPSLTLIKQVVNDNGGVATPADWTLTATGPTGFSGVGPTVNNGASFDAGAYALTESSVTGYTNGTYACVGGTQTGQSIAVALGESAVCTVINTDNAPSLTLVKQVVNDNGGTATPGDWTLTATGPTGFSGVGPTVNNGVSFAAGSYALTESSATGYTNGTYACVGGTQTGQSIAVALGESATCTVINNDNAPSLTLVKQVVNDNGGAATPAAWTLTATGPTGFSGVGPTVNNGASFDAGAYTLTESSVTGYTNGTYACVGGTQTGQSIAVALGESAVCTVINTDNAPSLTLIKQVVNDNGGAATPADWTLTATGPSGFSGVGPTVNNGVSFDAGAYALTESSVTGYTNGTYACVGGTLVGQTVTVALGESATCTVINTDNAPSLTLVKQVVNDNGGTATPASWTLTATGPTGFSGVGPTVNNGASFDAGAYALTESSVTGYTNGTYACVGGTLVGQTVTVAVGESATCTVINTDNAPSLTLIKQVVNDNGGTATPANWTLTATGPTGFSGAGPTVNNGASFDAGAYALTESSVTGYTNGAYACVGGTLVGQTVTVALGQSATCTVTNNDQPGTLIVKKLVINDNGGPKIATNFAFEVNGSGPTAFVQDGVNTLAGINSLTVNAGIYNVVESAFPIVGYTTSYSNCASVAVTNGGTATCTITNDDQPGTIVIIKNATPGQGNFTFTTTGTGLSGFTLDGDPALNNTTETVTGLSVGTYSVTEGTQLGWLLTGIGGSIDPTTPYACVVTGGNGSTGLGNLDTRTVAIGLKNGDTVTCTFENTGNGATRTQGFWQTHPELAQIAWFGGTRFGHTFPGVAATPGIMDRLMCTRAIDGLGPNVPGDISKLMGGFWSSVPSKSDGSKRTAIEQARMQALQQLLAAELNASAFGSAPATGSFGAWEAALCGTNTNAVKSAQQDAARFNNSGDSSTFTPGTSANSRYARQIADIVFWNIVKP